MLAHNTQVYLHTDAHTHTHTQGGGRNPGT